MDLDLEDVRFFLHRRGCYLDQLCRLYCDKYENEEKNSQTTSLFDCLIVTELHQQSHHFKPQITMKYPPNYQEIPEGIEMFCFPDAEYWSPQDEFIDDLSVEGFGRTHFLVLTDLQGNRRFGYCRRILPEGARAALPLAYCLISSRKSRIYPMILKELEALHGSNEDLLQETWRLLHSQSFPRTVNEPIFVCHADKVVKRIKRPLNQTGGSHDHCVFFDTIGIDNLIKLIYSALMEQKIILMGLSMAKISTVVESLCALLAPFAWHHTLIPILPYSLINILDAPTPYIIGLHDSDHLEDDILSELEDVTMFHLDYENSVISEMSDDGFDVFSDTSLVKVLKHRLQIIRNLAQEECKTVSILNDMTSEVFTKFFLALLGDYTKFIEIQQDQSPEFQLQEFLKSTSGEDHSHFLKQFVETCMFQNFVHDKFRLTLNPCQSKKCTLGVKNSKKIKRKISPRNQLENFLQVSSDQVPEPLTRLEKPPDEITIQLTGKINRFLQVPAHHTFRHLHKKLGCRQLMVQYSIPPSPTANIWDVFQVFKNSQGVLQILVD